MLGSLLRFGKKGRVHKPEEIYQRRYKEKIDILMKVEVSEYWLAHKGGENAPASLGKEEIEMDNNDTDADDEAIVEGQDEDISEGSPRAHEETSDSTGDKGSRHFKSWHMSTRRRVVREAWEAEPEEVKESIRKEVELEKKNLFELNDADKEGL